MERIDRAAITRMELFDSNCRLGPSELSPDSAPTSVPALLQEMDRTGIAEALLYHAAAGYAPDYGNPQLDAEAGAEPRLHRCWVIMPHHTGEIDPPPVLVERLAAAGVRAVRMMPRLHRYSLEPESVDPLLSELACCRLPLFLDFGRQHWAEEVTPYAQVARICRQFPQLPVVLVREGIGSARYLYPLLEAFENLAIEISYYQAADGIEDICRRFGAGRLLFGTGLPDYAAGPAITMLHLAAITDDERRLVAGGNLRRLLGSVLTPEGSAQ